MPGSKSDFLETALLDHSLGGPDYVRPANVHLALFSVAPTDAGGGTEITGGAYPRKAVTNNSTNFPAASGGSKSLATPQAFDVVPSGGLADAVAFGIFDAATGGNLLRWGWLGSDAGKTFYGRASDNVLIAPGHTLVNNDQARVLARPGETLPAGISVGTTYFVVNVSGNTLQLSATQGGAAIDITADGVGLVAKITVKPLTEGDTPTFSGGSLVISED
jgi:hypothetical protein